MAHQRPPAFGGDDARDGPADSGSWVGHQVGPCRAYCQLAESTKRNPELKTDDGLPVVAKRQKHRVHDRQANGVRDPSP